MLSSRVARNAGENRRRPAQTGEIFPRGIGSSQLGASSRGAHELWSPGRGRALRRRHIDSIKHDSVQKNSIVGCWDLRRCVEAEWVWSRSSISEYTLHLTKMSNKCSHQETLTRNPEGQRPSYKQKAKKPMHSCKPKTQPSNALRAPSASSPPANKRS
jgi:hypothetical protein